MSKPSPWLLGQIVLLAGCFLSFFHPTIVDLANDWSTNDNYSHGYLIPFITGYMLWKKREELAAIPPAPTWWGLVFLAGAILLHVAGNIGAELFTMRFSMVLCVAGLALSILGPALTRRMAVPLAYLVFMIPLPAIIWNQLAFPLQLFAAQCTAEVVRAIGIPILREGNILHLAATSLEVVDACSGLRSLTSLLALGGAFAYLTPLGNAGRWILFLSAIPIAVLVNVIRLTATAIMATRIGAKAAQGFLHDMSGMVVFILAFLLLFMVSSLLTRLETRFGIGAKPPEPLPDPSRRG